MPGSGAERFRAAVWRLHGARDPELAELLTYGRNLFDHTRTPPPDAYPLPDEPFVSVWDGYVAAAKRVGVFPCLRERLVQLRFPIARGISATDEYRAATRRGVLRGATAELQLVRPEGLRLFVHPTAAGRIPVIVAEEREDFVSLVRALTRHNEPDPIPDSLGACIVAGYNNWDRVAALRADWEAMHAGELSVTGWWAAFQELVPRKELYQDRFILLSSGPYSAAPAKALGLAERAWLAASLVLRLEHECAHYFTRRVLGSMRNSVLDELVADYVGIVAAAGRYRADWFLRFMGLEGFPRYRRGGRLENYRGDPPLSERAFTVLTAVIQRAARELERFAVARGGGLAETALAITALTRVGLERLASDRAQVCLRRAFGGPASRSLGVLLGRPEGISQYRGVGSVI